jgi:predicted regulator of Ras-like GTPase activity (Roadblock/LC7/MglB family)
MSSMTTFKTLLREMNKQGGFLAATLSDTQGLCIAAAADINYDLDVQSAVAALVQKAARQIQSQLGMEQPDEITVRDIDGTRLVSRPFKANGQELFLSVLISDRQCYRRLTSQAIRNIQREWRI